MYDELTPVDIQKMKEEIEYRVTVLRPKLIEDVKTAREWGDLSENFEYKAAKREKNRNDSRVRYLERMIRTAKVVEFQQTEGIGLFDEVETYLDVGYTMAYMDGEGMAWRVRRISGQGSSEAGDGSGGEAPVTLTAGDIDGMDVSACENTLVSEVEA